MSGMFSHLRQLITVCFACDDRPATKGVLGKSTHILTNLVLPPREATGTSDLAENYMRRRRRRPLHASIRESEPTRSALHRSGYMENTCRNCQLAVCIVYDPGIEILRRAQE